MNSFIKRFIKFNLKDIFIPKTINIDSKEYIITSILENAFENNSTIKTVRFSEDSELQIIGKRAFYNSSLVTITIPRTVTRICEKSFCCSQLKQIIIPDDSNLQTIEKTAFYGCTLSCFSIPPSVTELQKGWNTALIIKSFSISSNNKNYSNYNDTFILGKSDIKSDNFDTILCCRNDAKNVTIPSFIKIIGSYSFELNDSIQKVDFLEDSLLHTIGENAFAHSSLKRISLPCSVKRIEDSAFLFCSKLETFEIPENSELQMIDNAAFFYTYLECITIPKNAVDLKKGWCRRMKTPKFKISPENKNYLNYKDMFILGKTDQNSDIFDILLYARYDIEIAIIPSFIKIIGISAFEHCDKLTRVDIPNDSCLQKIEQSAFTSTKIKQIFIPSHVKKIGSSVFSACKLLSRIEFADDSELQTIGNSVFNGCNLDYFAIPNNVIELKPEWSLGMTTNKFKISSECKNYKNFNDVFILGKSDINIQNFDVIVYCSCDVKTVFIPSFIRCRVFLCMQEFKNCCL